LYAQLDKGEEEADLPSAVCLEQYQQLRIAVIKSISMLDSIEPASDMNIAKQTYA